MLILAAAIGGAVVLLGDDDDAATDRSTTTTTTTLPPAATVADAIAQVIDRSPGVSVVDDSGFRLRGASVLIGEESNGGMRAFLFGDGRLLGTDTRDPSTAVSLVSISDDVVVLRYELWAAGVGPPDPPAGASEVTLTWDGGDAFVPASEFPSSDISVDGHR